MLATKVSSNCCFRAANKAPSTGRCIVHTQATGKHASPSKVTPAVLATIMTLTLGAPVMDGFNLLPLAHADEEVEENLTPYQKRQRELEKRREMLRQAREAASERASSAPEVRQQQSEAAVNQANAAVEAANAQRRAEAERLKEELKAQLAASEPGKFTPPPPPPAPAPAAPPPAPEVSKPSGFSLFSSTPAPAPEVKAPEPAKPAAKAVKAEPAKKEEGKKKRKGPLPLFLVQILMLGAFVGVGAASTKYNEQSSSALSFLSNKVRELTEAAESKLRKL